MFAPVGWPWDPRKQLPPGYNDGMQGAVEGWNNLVYVLTTIVPQAWNELIAQL